MIVLHIGIDQFPHHIDVGILPGKLLSLLHRLLIAHHMCLRPDIQIFHRGCYQLIKQIRFILTMPVDSCSRHLATVSDTAHGCLFIAHLQKFRSCGRHDLNMTE